MIDINEIQEVENDMLQTIDLGRLGQELSYTERTMTNGTEEVTIEVVNILEENQSRPELTLRETGCIVGLCVFYYHKIEAATGRTPDEVIPNGVQETELVKLYRARFDHYSRA